MAKTVDPRAARQAKLEALKKRMQNIDLGGSAGFWSPKEGKSVIRILPEVGDMEFYFQPVGRHFFPDKKWVTCRQFTTDGAEECPVCDVVKQLDRGDKASKALASELARRKSFWMNVVVRGRRDPRTGEQIEDDRGPFIYTPGQGVFQSIMSIINDPDYGMIFDPEDGYDITIERSGTGLDTEYEVRPKPKSSPLSHDAEQAQEWLDKAQDLSWVEVTEDPEEDKDIIGNHAVYIMPYDRMVAEFKLNEVDEMDVDSYSSSKSEPSNKSSKSSRKAEPEQTRSAKRAKPAPVVEEVDDEEDEEVDDEEDEDDEEELRRAAQQRKASRSTSRR